MNLRRKITFFLTLCRHPDDFFNMASNPSSLVSPARSQINLIPAAISAALIVLGLIYLNGAVSGRQAALWIVGTLLGATLYHSAFGFTSSWRVFISDRRGAGLRAQMLMLAFGCLLFFPVLGNGSLWGQNVSGFVSPVGTSVLVGAFIFGIGMQMGGGCASGTLYTVGGGSTRMIITLIGFIIGSVIGAAHLPWWAAQPSFAPYSIVKEWGVSTALISNFVLFLVIALFTIWAEKRRHGTLISSAVSAGKAGGWGRLLSGPWPLVIGSVVLVLLNFATLALAGRPWGITSAFALWGSKLLMAVGYDVSGWGFWQGPAAASLAAPLRNDITSVMDIGIVLGALLAASLAGKFAPVWSLPARSILAAILGGLLLGYGARLAFGCNIGAYFSGILSGSLHGWLWLVAAFAGNVIGTRIRPFFGLTVEKTSQTAC